MKLKYKFLKKVLSIALITEMVLNPVLVPWTIYAQEADPTPTPTVTIEEITPTPTPEQQSQSESTPTPTPTETPSSTTTTGDSSATAQSDTTANQTQTTVEGQVGATSCTPEGTVSCPVDQSNSADVSSGTSADSTSGDNQSTNSQGDASITTGTATSSATTTNTINTTIVEATPSATPEVTITITPTPGDSSISVDNGATVETSTTADSTSGGNDTSGNGNDAAIKTGDSYSSAAVVNAVNTTIIGSNYRFLIYNIYAEENATINLNEIWKEIEAAIGANASIVPSEANTLAITIKNDASVTSNVSATSTSGDNTANENGGNVTIVTGNSFASANLFNLINTNIIGANFLFVIINIFGTLNGDIVVPSQEKFNESMGAYNQGGIDLSAGSVVIDNYARVEGSKALADANSGNNQSSGGSDQATTTGKAYASATTIDVLNTTLSWENWMNFIINNFGSWSGTVKGWGDPSSSTQAASGESTTLNHTTGGQEVDPASANNTNETNSSNTTIQNNANVTSDVSAKADSGSNQANDNGGDISIFTGMAIALANVMNFINTNIFGGRFLFVFINIFGRWNGDFVLAHPDLQIAIQGSTETADPGQEVEYTISYTNKGYEDARNAVVEMTFPKDMTYVGNSLEVSPAISGSLYSFPIGNVLWGEGGSFKVLTKVNNSISPDEQASNSLFEKLKDKIVAKAYAQDREKNLIVNVQITTLDPDSDQNNNTASATTKVIIPEQTSNESNSSNETNYGTPNLEITSSHNVGEYVYPGDIVTFFVTIKNTGNGTAHNVKLYQSLYDGTPDPVGTISLDIGNVETSKGYKINYGLTIPTDIIPGLYHSNIFVEGNSESGEKVTSNESITDFLIKEKYSGFVQPVQAQEESAGQENNVLGEQTTPPCKKEKDYLPYILSGILAILWFIDHLRRKRLEKELKSTLNKEG